MKQEKKDKPKERPKYNMWQNYAFMIQEAWQTRKSVLWLGITVVILAVATNLAELYLAPVVLRKVELGVSFLELLVTILLFTLLLMGLAALTAYVNQNTLFGRVEVRCSIIRKIYHKTTTTSFPNTEDSNLLKNLEKAERATDTNGAAGEAIWGTLVSLLQNVIGFVIYMRLLSSVDFLMIAVVLVTTIAGYFINQRFMEWGYEHRQEEAEYGSRMYYISNKAENTALAKDIRIFGMRPWLEDVFAASLRLYQGFLARREKRYLCANLIDVLLAFLRNGIAYFYLIRQTLENGLPASEFLLYFTAVGGFASWVTGILSGLTTLHKQSLDLSVVRGYLDAPEPFRFTGGEPLENKKGAAYELELKNVSFRYPEAEKDTLHHLNLTIHPGEKLAVVGLNGAGKTTLVKLLCGFYDPTEGQVLLNGEDIKGFNRREYYQLFTAVFQQFSVLEVSVEENVTQSTKKADRKKVEECIAKAGLTEKIQSLPKGYETPVGKLVYEDGVEFSGGEIQRLMLARALYKNAPIIVLDEPTAALDPIAENDIYLKYNEMTRGCTSVYISHRLASTRFCDRIILLADGNIAEEGTHDSLMAQQGKYAELFSVQSKYYAKGGEEYAEE